MSAVDQLTYASKAMQLAHNIRKHPTVFPWERVLTGRVLISDDKVMELFPNTFIMDPVSRRELMQDLVPEFTLMGMAQARLIVFKPLGWVLSHIGFRQVVEMAKLFRMANEDFTKGRRQMILYDADGKVK